jgi:hypothetical protein
MAIDRVGIASDAFAVTPSDSAAQRAYAVWVGGAGNVAVRTEDGTTVTFTGAQAGTILPVRVSQVLATGTTATAICGFR